MSKKNQFIKNQNETDTPQILNVLLVPISILLAGLFVSVSLLYSAGRIIDQDQIVTKSNLNAAITESLRNANINNGTANNGDQPAEDIANPLVKASIDDDPRKGNTDAKVAIIEFSDYECPFCQRHFEETHPKLMSDYVDTGKVLFVFRDNPLSFHEPMASLAATGMNCAKEQGGDNKYFELHDLYFKNTQTNAEGLPGGNEEFAKYAEQIGLDKAKFTECLNSNKFADEIAKDMADAQAAGASGTPGFIIGKLDANGIVDGELVSGAYPLATFQEVIEKYLNS